MSTIENPSEQVQVVIDALKDYAAGDITAFGDKFTEDFARENLPTSMRSSGEGLLGEKTKAEFMAKMKFLRTSVFKDDFKIVFTDVVEQPGRFVLFGLQTSSTTLDEPFQTEIAQIVDVRRDSDGKLRISHIKEFLDSASMAKFGAAVKKRFPTGPPS